MSNKNNQFEQIAIILMFLEVYKLLISPFNSQIFELPIFYFEMKNNPN
jgi:hypothetical protein